MRAGFGARRSPVFGSRKRAGIRGGTADDHQGNTGFAAACALRREARVLRPLRTGSRDPRGRGGDEIRLRRTRVSALSPRGVPHDRRLHRGDDGAAHPRTRCIGDRSDLARPLDNHRRGRAGRRAGARAIRDRRGPVGHRRSAGRAAAASPLGPLPERGPGLRIGLLARARRRGNGGKGAAFRRCRVPGGQDAGRPPLVRGRGRGERAQGARGGRAGGRCHGRREHGMDRGPGDCHGPQIRAVRHLLAGRAGFTGGFPRLLPDRGSARHPGGRRREPLYPLRSPPVLRAAGHPHPAAGRRPGGTDGAAQDCGPCGYLGDDDRAPTSTRS